MSNKLLFLTVLLFIVFLFINLSLNFLCDPSGSISLRPFIELLQMLGYEQATQCKEGFGIIGGILDVCISFFAILIGIGSGYRYIIPGIKVYRVNAPGDDLKIMMNYFEKADKLIVFAGDFNWLTDDSLLGGVVEKLALEQSVNLVSNRHETLRGSALLKYSDGRMCHIPGHKFKCSYVSASGAEAVLYKHKLSIDDEELVVVIENIGLMRNVVKAIKEFMELIVSLKCSGGVAP